MPLNGALNFLWRELFGLAGQDPKRKPKHDIEWNCAKRPFQPGLHGGQDHTCDVKEEQPQFQGMLEGIFGIFPERADKKIHNPGINKGPYQETDDPQAGQHGQVDVVRLPDGYGDPLGLTGAQRCSGNLQTRQRAAETFTDQDRDGCCQPMADRLAPDFQTPVCGAYVGQIIVGVDGLKVLRITGSIFGTRYAQDMKFCTRPCRA